MSARKSYEKINFPKDYYFELLANKTPEWADRFSAYFMSVSLGLNRGVRYWADAWGYKSTATPHKWIKKFDEEISRFNNYWQLKNDQPSPIVEKGREQKENKKRTEETLNLGADEPLREQNREQKENITKDVEEVVIMPSKPERENQNLQVNTEVEREVRELIDVWMFNGGNWGVKRDELIREWLRLRGKIPLRRIKEAIVAYVHDGEIKNRYGLVKFLELGVYALYMRVRIRVLNRESMSWLVGEYSKKEETLYTSNGKFKLAYEVIVDKYRAGELEFEFEEVA